MTKRRFLPILLCLLVSAAAFYALLFPASPLTRPQGAAPAEVDDRPTLVPHLSARPVNVPPGAEPVPPAREGQIRGRVVDLRTRAPVDGARVFVPRTSEDALFLSDAAVRTDARGEFTLERRAPERTALWVTASGYLPWQGVADVTAANVEVELDAGVTLDGVVVDLSGSPIQGVLVSCAPSKQRLGWPHDPRFLSDLGTSGGVGETDFNGRFSIGGLAPDATYEVQARKLGWTRAGTFTPQKVTPGRQDLRIVMRREAVLRVRVQADDGSILTEEATVILTPPDGWGWSSSLERQLDGRLQRETTLPTKDGWVTYRLSQTTPLSGDAVTEVEVEATAPGLAVGSARAGISPDSESEIVLVLRRTSSDRVRMPVSFRAHLPTGEPLRGGFTVMIRTPAGEYWTSAMVFGDDGITLRSRDLPPGANAIRVGPGLGVENDQFWPVADWYEFVVQAVGPAQSVELPCRGNRLQLRVTSPEGQAVRGYDLRVRADVGARRVGNWRFVRDLPLALEASPPELFVSPGKSSLEFSLSDVGGAEVLVEAPGDGSGLTLDVRLERGKEVPWSAIFERHEGR